MSLFDPTLAEDLLNADLEANATRRDPAPQGEVNAQIVDQKIKTGKSGPKSQNPGSPWARLDLSLEITDPEYLSQIPDSPEKLKMTLGVMLDLTESGTIATGANKNIRLGRLREAAGCNGKPLSALLGNYLRIQISHKPHPTEEGVILDEITAYTKAV